MALGPTRVRDIQTDKLKEFAENASLRGKKSTKERPKPRSFTLHDDEDQLIDSLCVKAKTRLTRTDVVRMGIQLMDNMTEEEFREMALRYRQDIKDKRDSDQHDG